MSSVGVSGGGVLLSVFYYSPPHPLSIQCSRRLIKLFCKERVRVVSSLLSTFCYYQSESKQVI